MAYGSTAPSPTLRAEGIITDVRSEVKAKKAGGTFTINLAELNSGVVVDFGFKPVAGRKGDYVDWAVAKKFGKYEYQGPGNPGYPPASPLAARAVPAAAGGGSAPPPSGGGGGYSGKPFPLPRSHGDTAIIRQNALTNAVKIHGDALAATKAAGGVVMDDYVNGIIKTAYKLAAFSSGNLDNEIAEEVAERAAAKKSKAKAAPAPVSDDEEVF